ncbi:MAG: alpha/beta fold hydrolase [Calditrichaeota bacterium]|nr:alpha/beta fold hydrolase [Calditrichota bacterium]
MIRQTFSLRNDSGEPVNFDLRFSEGTSHAPVIILLHGFKGFKDWGFFPDLATSLARSDYVTLALNFSRNGIGADGKNFTALDRFAENTISHELADVQKIMEALLEGKIGKQVIDPERIGILGHSRGGAVALLTALEYPEEIGAVVTWASVGNLFRFSPEQIEQWNEIGYIEIENKRTRQIMRINRTYWDDLQKNKDRFNLYEQVKELEAPALFIHGSADKSVSPEESRLLSENCGAASKRLEIIEETDHTFGIKHPFEIGTEAYNIAKDLTESWFDRHLKY